MMKNNNKKKGNTAKKLLPAAMMLAVSASMLGTSTYAWFTMNKEVTVTGMQLKTTVSSNLLISETNTSDATFSTALYQSRSALLEPVSTIDGYQFYYTVNALANGDAMSDEYTAYSEAAALSAADTFANKTNYDSTFNGSSKYNISTANTSGVYKTAYGYVDYNFYIKATSTADAQKIAMTKCDLLYDDDGDAATAPVAVTDKAWRVALFAQDLSSGSSTGQGVTGNVPSAAATSILKMSAAAYQDNTPKAVASTTGLDAITNLGAAANVATGLNSGDTKYYYVTVRVWLEGEDTDCTTEMYGPLKNGYVLDCKFELKAADGITAFTSNAYTAASGDVFTFNITKNGESSPTAYTYTFNGTTWAPSTTPANTSGYHWIIDGATVSDLPAYITSHATGNKQSVNVTEAANT